MALGDVIARLSVVLGLDTATFEQGATVAEKRLAQSARRFDKIGKSMSDLGTKLSVVMTAPLIALGAKAVQGAQDQAQAMAQVDAALTSMGSASGKTAKELLKTSDALELNSLFDGDVILKQVTANLLTFGNVANEQFDRAQQAALDMAQRMGGEPQAAAIMLGKALNDPVKGITALTRVGVQFTAQQKAQIKAMSEAGNMAGAQKIILSEVERQFAGAAKAAADTSPWRKAQVAFGQAGDAIGEKILPLIPRLTDAVVKVLDAFGKLSPEMQTAIVAGAAVAAALGPIIMGAGALVSALSPLLGAFSLLGGAASVGAAAGATATGSAFAGLAAVLGPLLPVIAAVAAAGALIYANWDKIAPVLKELWEQAQEALGPPLQEIISTLSSTLSELWNGPLGTALRAVIASLVDLSLSWAKAIGPVVIGLIKIAIGAISNFVGLVSDGVSFVSRLLKGDFAGAAEAAFSIFNRVFFGIPELVGRMVNAVRVWLVDRLGKIWDTVKGKIDQVKGWFFGLYDAVVGHSYVPDMVDGIAEQMRRLDQVMVAKAQSATDKTKSAFEKLAEEVAPLLDRLFPEAAAANKYRAERDTLNRSEAGGALSPEQANEARRRLALEGRSNGTIEGLLDKYGSPVTEGMPNFVAALDGMRKKVETTTVTVAKSFADMGRDVLGSLQNLGNSIKNGGFLDIFTGVFDLLLQLGSIGVFGKNIAANLKSSSASIPAYATGTNFHPGGLALVGERGPELVSMPRGSRVTPNNKLRGGAPYFDLRGAVLTADLVAQMNRIGQATGMGGAMAGANLAENKMAHRARRTIR